MSAATGLGSHSRKPSEDQLLSQAEFGNVPLQQQEPPVDAAEVRKVAATTPPPEGWANHPGLSTFYHKT